MTEYTELVKALRGKFIAYDVTGNHNSAQLYKGAAAAIEELQSILTEADKKRAYQHDYICELVAEKEELQAEVERLEPKRGEWVGVNPMVDSVQCSICGGQLFSAELETPYCPYCGAKMEVQE